VLNQPCGPFHRACPVSGAMAFGIHDDVLDTAGLLHVLDFCLTSMRQPQQRLSRLLGVMYHGTVQRYGTVTQIDLLRMRCVGPLSPDNSRHSKQSSVRASLTRCQPTGLRYDRKLCYKKQFTDCFVRGLTCATHLLWVCRSCRRLRLYCACSQVRLSGACHSAVCRRVAG
jgi:hypothetical protein